MCKCTPSLRTLFCGRPGCEWPDQGASFTSALPSPYERELLDIAGEELAEIVTECSAICAAAIRCISKLKRFGATETQPGQSFDNVHRLSEEIGDLMEVIDQLAKLGLVSMDVVEMQKPLKRAKLRRFMLHAREPG